MVTKPKEVHTPAELPGLIRSESHSDSHGRGGLGFGGQREVRQHLVKVIKKKNLKAQRKELFREMR